MGRDTGTPYTKEDFAFEYFLFWVVGGLIFSFGLAFVTLSKAILFVPILFYFFIMILLFIRYVIIERRVNKNG